jgi:nucleoside-diphosphate-sugar epimerase
VTVFGDGSQTRSFCYVVGPDRRHRPPVAFERGAAGQHRQPARDHDPGWEPKVSLEDGLRMTLEYFKKAVAKQQAAKANGK